MTIQSTLRPFLRSWTAWKRIVLAGPALGLFAVLFALLIAEAGLRLYGFSFRLYPEVLEFGWPNLRHLPEAMVPDPDLFWVRREYQQILSTAGQNLPLDIAFMGDSCTRQGGYPEQLADMLLKRFGDKPCRFANFGCDGYSSFQGLAQLKRDVLPLRPKLVTLYYGWNDHWIGLGIQDKEAAHFNTSLLFSLKSSRVLQLIIKYLSLKDLDPDGKYRPRRVTLWDFRENLGAMARLIRSEGGVPVLLTAPSNHELGKEPQFLGGSWLVDYREVVPLHLAYVEAVREVALAEKVPLCDLYERIQAIPADQRRPLFWSDGIHFTDAGKHQVALLLFDCLMSNGAAAAAFAGQPEEADTNEE